jgi:hypothetical protein
LIFESGDFGVNVQLGAAPLLAVFVDDSAAVDFAQDGDPALGRLAAHRVRLHRHDLRLHERGGRVALLNQILHLLGHARHERVEQPHQVSFAPAPVTFRLRCSSNAWERGLQKPRSK